jgi:hypothetical protein
MVDFFFGIHLSVIIPPNVFSEKEIKILSSDTTFAGLFSFKVSPESFQPVNMISTLSVFLFLMLYGPVDITF